MNPQIPQWLCLACGNIGPMDDGACEKCGSFRLVLTPSADAKELTPDEKLEQVRPPFIKHKFWPPKGGG